jgi:hypothetical protein
LSNCGKSTFLTLTLRFHALVNSGIKIFGFGSEKWISLVGKKLPYFSNSYMDENSYLDSIYCTVITNTTLYASLTWQIN